MRIVLALNKESAAYVLLLHDPDKDVKVFVDVPANEAEELKKILTDVEEDKYFIYYRPKNQGDYIL